MNSLAFTSAPFAHLLALLLTIDFATPIAHADFFVHTWESQHAPARTLRLAPELLIYTGTGNFSDAGSTVDVSNLQNYSRIGLETTGAYGFNEQLTAYVRLAWHRVEVQQTGQVAATGYGLADQSIGLNLRALGAQPNAQVTDTAASLDFQLQFDFPGYNNTSSATNRTPSLGDQSKDVSVGFLTLIPLTDVTGSYSHVTSLYGGAAFTYRSDSYSMAIPWSGGLRIDPVRSGLLLKAGVVGTTSLTSDAFSNPGVTMHPDVPATASGGMLTTGAVNPSLMAGLLKVGYQTSESLAFHASGLVPFYGKTAPNGIGIFAGLTIHFLPAAHAAQTTRAKNPQSLQTLQAITPSPVKPRTANSQNPQQNFITYTAFEGKITRVNDRLNLIKMNQGSASQVKVGQVFDLFSVNKNGAAKEWVARARCTEVQDAEATLNVETFYKEVLIEEGFVAKMPVLTSFPE